MIEPQKYRRLAQQLGKPGEEGNHEEEAEFYFHQLERLEIDLLVAEIEVTEQQRQILALESKIGLVQAEHQRNEPEPRKLNDSSSEEVPREYACPLKDCGKRFQKQSGVRLHQQLTHGSGVSWLSGELYELSLEEGP